MEKAIKGIVLEAYTQTKRAGICFACALHDMFSGFNTARKAAWLKLTQLERASDRKDSQMPHPCNEVQAVPRYTFGMHRYNMHVCKELWKD